MHMMLPCSWSRVAACDLLLSLRGQSPVQAQRAPSTSNVGKGRRAQPANSSQTPHGWTAWNCSCGGWSLKLLPKGMSPLSTEIQHTASLGFVHMSPARLCISAHVLTAGIESLSMKGIFGFFLAFEKGTISWCLCNQRALAEAGTSFCSSLAHSKADQGTQNLRQRFCSLWLGELESKQPFTCQNKSPCGAIEHYGSWRKNGGVVTCTDPIWWFSHRNGKEKTDFLILILLNHFEVQNKALPLFWRTNTPPP